MMSQSSEHCRVTTKGERGWLAGLRPAMRWTRRVDHFISQSIGLYWFLSCAYLRRPRNMPLRFRVYLHGQWKCRGPGVSCSLLSASSFLGIHMRCLPMIRLTTRSLPLTALYFLLSWHQCLSHMRYCFLTENAMRASGLA